jgi:hypothetical protein
VTNAIRNEFEREMRHARRPDSAKSSWRVWQATNCGRGALLARATKMERHYAREAGVGRLKPAPPKVARY